MAGNRKPKKPEERFNPEQEGEEEEEDGVDDDNDEEEEQETPGSSDTYADSPPDSPLTRKIRLARENNRRLEEQLAGYGPQVAAATTMQVQFTEAVNAIETCMDNIKRSMTAKQQAHFSQWAENRMSDLTQGQASPETKIESGASTSAGLGAGADFHQEGEDFKTIRDCFDKLKRLIALREEAEAGGWIKFSEASQKEIAQMANQNDADNSGSTYDEVDTRAISTDGVTEGGAAAGETFDKEDECGAEVEGQDEK